MTGTSIDPSGIQIRRVSADAVIPLRHAVLRAGLPVETARFEGDDEPATAHFGAFEAADLIGCATVLSRPWNLEAAWQVRGMAVAPGRRRGGIGRELLVAIEALVRGQGATILWCNARKPAAGFYERLGWRIASDEFEIPSAGPHFKMVKNI